VVVLDLQISPDIQRQKTDLPQREWFEKWILAALTMADRNAEHELTVRIVDEAEIKTLNETYRHKSGVTNVLSFPFEAPAEVPLSADFAEEFLGDIVICAPVIQREARQQNKPLSNHWAHMTVHGTLHLLGYDHVTAQQAEEMETLEIAVLSKFGIPNPYTETQAQ
jgi:probable rRNA maturation factor